MPLYEGTNAMSVGGPLQNSLCCGFLCGAVYSALNLPSLMLVVPKAGMMYIMLRCNLKIRKVRTEALCTYGCTDPW